MNQHPKRPRDIAQLAYTIAGIATGDIQEAPEQPDTRNPAAVRFISAEPLLGALDLINIARDPNGDEEISEKDDAFGSPMGGANGIDWVIVGGESGPNARPMHPDWARSLRDQCQAAGVPYFFKQWGTWQPISTSDGFQKSPFGKYDAVGVEDSKGGIFYANFIRKGKAESGRTLDGRTWEEFPKGVIA